MFHDLAPIYKVQAKLDSYHNGIDVENNVVGYPDRNDACNHDRENMFARSLWHLQNKEMDDKLPQKEQHCRLDNEVIINSKCDNITYTTLSYSENQNYRYTIYWQHQRGLVTLVLFSLSFCWRCCCYIICNGFLPSTISP